MSPEISNVHKIFTFTKDYKLDHHIKDGGEQLESLYTNRLLILKTIKRFLNVLGSNPECTGRAKDCEK